MAEIDFFKFAFCILIVAAVTESLEKVKPWVSLLIIVIMTVWAFAHFFSILYNVINSAYLGD